MLQENLYIATVRGKKKISHKGEKWEVFFSRAQKIAEKNKINQPIKGSGMYLSAGKWVFFSLKKNFWPRTHAKRQV